jgi:hypothetical protein
VFTVTSYKLRIYRSAACGLSPPRQWRSIILSPPRKFQRKQFAAAHDAQPMTNFICLPWHGDSPSLNWDDRRAVIPTLRGTSHTRAVGPDRSIVDLFNVAHRRQIKSLDKFDFNVRTAGRRPMWRGHPVTPESGLSPTPPESKKFSCHGGPDLVHRKMGRFDTG